MSDLTRNEVEVMIEKEIFSLEKRIELKIDLIIQMLKTEQSDQESIKTEQISHRGRLNQIDIDRAGRSDTCPFRGRVEKLEKIAIKTSIYTGLIMGLLWFALPYLVRALGF